MPSWDETSKPIQLGLFDRASMLPRTAPAPAAPAAGPYPVPLARGWWPCSFCETREACSDGLRCKVFGF